MNLDNGKRKLVHREHIIKILTNGKEIQKSQIKVIGLKTLKKNKKSNEYKTNNNSKTKKTNNNIFKNLEYKNDLRKKNISRNNNIKDDNINQFTSSNKTIKKNDIKTYELDKKKVINNRNLNKNKINEKKINQSTNKNKNQKDILYIDLYKTKSNTTTSNSTIKTGYYGIFNEFKVKTNSSINVGANGKKKAINESEKGKENENKNSNTIDTITDKNTLDNKNKSENEIKNILENEKENENGTYLVRTDSFLKKKEDERYKGKIQFLFKKYKNILQKIQENDKINLGYRRRKSLFTPIPNQRGKTIDFHSEDYKLFDEVLRGAKELRRLEYVNYFINKEKEIPLPPKKKEIKIEEKVDDNKENKVVSIQSTIKSFLIRNVDLKIERLKLRECSKEVFCLLIEHNWNRALQRYVLRKFKDKFSDVFMETGNEINFRDKIQFKLPNCFYSGVKINDICSPDILKEKKLKYIDKELLC